MSALRTEIAELSEGFMLLPESGENEWFPKADGWTRALIESHLKLAEGYLTAGSQSSYDRGYEQGAEARDEDRDEERDRAEAQLRELVSLPDTAPLSDAKAIARKALDILE